VGFPSLPAVNVQTSNINLSPHNTYSIPIILVHYVVHVYRLNPVHNILSWCSTVETGYFFLSVSIIPLEYRQLPLWFFCYVYIFMFFSCYFPVTFWLLIT